VDRLVECVPNFSEGRNLTTIHALMNAVTSVAGVWLLDRTKDHDHHRAVLTFVGTPDAVAEAAFRAIRVATDLVVAYGHVQAVRGLSLHIGAGEIVALIGPNGAGKSSTLGALAGLVAPAAGSVKLAGADIAGRPAHAIVAAGVVLVPEGRAVLQRMTVEENLILGAESRRPRAPRAAIDAELERFPALRRRLRLPAGALSGERAYTDLFDPQSEFDVGHIRLARDADLLFIEAAFAQADAGLAAERSHLTTAAAGTIARDAQVRRVEPFHFSPRYAGQEEKMLKEVNAAFAGKMP